MVLIRGWRKFDVIALVALLAGAIAASWSAWRDIFTLAWHNPEQSHILLAIPVALWLGWLRRGRLARCQPEHSLLGPAIIAGAWVLGSFGLSHSIDLFWHLSAILLAVGAAMTVTGPKLWIRFAVPAVALLALLPVPVSIRMEIAQPLQDISARCSQFLLDIVGIPVVRTGNVLIINGESVAIAEACNGMRMVAALGLVAYTFAFSIPARRMVRVLLMVLSPLLAVVVNILRLMPTVLFYGYASKNTADAFHSFSGWFMMVAALGVMWGTIRLLRWMELPVLNYGAMRE